MISRARHASWSQKLLLPGLLSITLLTGCKTTGTTGTDLIVVKPSATQIESAAREVVCQSFKPITFSGKNDTSLTVSQVREHNAAYDTYRCGER